jgi:hypothetical protein
MLQIVVVALVITGAFVLLVQILWLRHRTAEMEHRERMAALEKGTAGPSGGTAAPWSPRVYLLRGLIWLFTGAALTLAMAGVSFIAPAHHHQDAEQLARIARDVSANLQIPVDEARRIVAKQDADRAAEDSGIPLALAGFGLVPLAVGVAYLVFYYKDPSRNALTPNGTYAPAPRP